MCCFGRQYANVAVDKEAAVIRKPPSRASQVITLDFRLSLIPGFRTPSDFLPIDDDDLPSAHQSNRSTQRYTIASRSGEVKTPSILRTGDGMSLASSGDQPRSIRLPPIETKASSLISAGDVVTIASSGVRTPISPRQSRFVVVPPSPLSSHQPVPPLPPLLSGPQAARVSTSPRVALPPVFPRAALPSPSPQADHPFFLSLSLPPPGLSLDFDFSF